MTNTTDIVTGAFREGNLTPIGVAPTAAELVEGLAALNRFVGSVYGLLLGEHLSDWEVPYNQRTGPGVEAYPPYLPGGRRPLVVLNNQYPQQNCRVVWDGSEQTVYFPEKPNDGARMAFARASGAAAAGVGNLTLDGNGRRIEGADTYVSDGVTVTSRAWLYRADLADWLALTSIGITDEFPFPQDLDDLWITATAVRLAPRYGKQVSPATVATLQRMTTLLKTRYTQHEPVESGGSELRQGFQSFYDGTGGDNFL